MRYSLRGNDRLDLKLIVIGIFLAVYWQSLPSLLVPTTINGVKVTFDMFKAAIFGTGLGWFIALIVGVFCLAFPEYKNLNKYFNFIFKLANIEITGFLIVVTIYYLLSIFLLPVI
ncbi:MAG: hypothetical protein M1433_01795 [Candidatus Parvarchaeota archaeon]|nr:hypothetical protein [Candidatus Parvarchaeota archaeon]